MNRIINITGNQIKNITKSTCVANCRTIQPTTFIPTTTTLPFQQYRYQSTNINEEQKKSIISNEFIPRRRIPSEYRPPISRRPKPIKIQDPDISFSDDNGLTILGRQDVENNDNIYETMWLPDEKYTNVMKIDDEVYKDDQLALDYNPFVSDALKYVERLKERGQHINATPSASIDEKLRIMDWITTEQGSTEDSIMKRRAFSEGTWDEKERKELQKNLDGMVEKLREESLDLPHEEFNPENKPIEGEEKDDESPEEDERSLVADAPWRDMIVDISRVQKVTRSGTIVSYRALVVGGNTRGVAGYGIGKGAEPDVATASAKRMCHRNIFFLTPYQGSGLTHDLVGKHNNCKVVIRAVSQGYGLHGNQLVQDILLAFGVTNATAKAYGRRNIYSVVYAAFKAVATHTDLEGVSLSRGKKFLSLDRARRLQFK